MVTLFSWLLHERAGLEVSSRRRLELSLLNMALDFNVTKSPTFQKLFLGSPRLRFALTILSDLCNRDTSYLRFSFSPRWLCEAMQWMSGDDNMWRSQSAQQL